MYLKTLEISGFKSFADRTKLEFDHNITIIVGPNGCGKTNIVEAILWVLGERTLRNLRADSPSSLIFSGSKTREPCSMAEVSLTFDNRTKLFPLNYDEVKVTRRLYRSGESEFLINDENVRLKDIQNLFLDTGLGVSSYSILKQGTVERIVNAKPEELRVFIDEAIGTSRFQKEKQEAERNIEKSTENLLRLSDIMEEVRKQLSSMDYQARKAKKYNQIKEEYEKLKVNFLYRTYLELQEKKKKLEETWKEKQNIWQELKDKIRSYSSILSELKLDYEKKRDELVNREREFYVSGYEIERMIKERRGLEQRLADIPKKIDFCTSKMKEILKVLDQKKNEEREIEKSFEEQKNFLKQKEEEWNKIQEFFKNENLEYVDEEDLEKKNNELFEKYREIISKENEIKTLEEKINELKLKRNKLEDEINEEKDKTFAIKKKLDKVLKDINIIKEEIKKIEEEILEKENKKFKNLREIREIEKEIAFKEGKKEEYVRKDISGNILGKVSDFVSVENKILKGYFLNRFNWFVVRTKEEALKLVEEFKDKDDFFVFVPLEELKSVKEEIKNHIKFSEGKESLSSIFNMDEILELHDDKIIFKWGGIATGKVKTLRELEEEIRKLKEELKVKNEVEEKLKEELIQLNKKKDENYKSLRSFEIEKEGFLKEIEKQDVFLKTLEREKSEIEKEILLRIEEKKEQTSIIEKDKTEIDELKNDIEKMKKIREIIRTKEKDHGKSFKEIKNDLFLAKDKVEAISSRLRGIRSEIEILNERLKDLKLEESALREEEEFLSERLKQLGDKIEGYMKNKGSMEGELKGIKEQLMRIDDEIKKKEDERRKIELDIEKEEEVRRTIYAELSRFDSEIASIDKRLNEIGFDLEKARIVYNPEIEVNEELLNNLQDKIVKFGNVNLSAPEEYDKLKKRFDFLKVQKEDLEKAIDDSKNLISKINSEIKERFLKHYEGIKNNFKKIFVKLFEGGEGDIVLTNKDDILQTGIDIKVTPPGKKVLSKQQLSGGELALSSIAFLFSFFMLKPSPICVLDEVDSPLDDSNVLRFIKLVKEFSLQTQFLIITHNKRTMEAGDVIYGVTMEELGVSKILSVNLKKLAEV